MALLTILGDRLARFGLAARPTEAEIELTDPEHARRLIDDPLLWSLWMPGVQDILDEPRASASLRGSARSASGRAGRLGLSGGNRQAHIQIVSYGSGRMAWQLLPGKHIEHYSVEVVGGLVRTTASGGESALVLAHELERQSRP